MISKLALAAAVALCASAAAAADVMIVGIGDSGRGVPYWTAIPEESCKTLLLEFKAALRRHRKFNLELEARSINDLDGEGPTFAVGGNLVSLACVHLGGSIDSIETTR